MVRGSGPPSIVPAAITIVQAVITHSLGLLTKDMK